jgi:Ricin-type beta-trefoil lectin domain.
MNRHSSFPILFLLGISISIFLAACSTAPVSLSPAAPATADSATATALPTVASSTATSTVPAAPTQTQTGSASATLYAVQQAFSKLYLTASSDRAGATLTQETGGNQASQRWQFIPLSQADAGFYQIQSSSGAFCLENNGDSVILNPCNGADNQKWQTVPCLNYHATLTCSKTNGSAVYLQSRQPQVANDYTKGFNVSFLGKVMGLLDCDKVKDSDDPNMTTCATAGWQINSQGVTGGHDLLWYLIPQK